MFIINQKIRDIDTQQPLIGATVLLVDSNGQPLLVNGYQVGRVSNDQGAFVLPVVPEDAFIKVSYIGYNPIIHPADDYRNDDIYLKAKEISATSTDTVIKAKYQPKKKKWWLIPVLVACGLLLIGATYYLTTKK